MSKIIKYDEEKRRKELINKLITYGVYKVDKTTSFSIIPSRFRKGIQKVSRGCSSALYIGFTLDQ